jgi:NitT/TauT family transport system ATP-binding protein
MTARPGRIKAHLEVTLPRPRAPEVTGDPDFIRLKERCLALLHDEAPAEERVAPVPA